MLPEDYNKKVQSSVEHTTFSIAIVSTIMVAVAGISLFLVS